MTPALLHLYHHLLPSARTAAATVHGVYLRWRRYGGDSKTLVEQAEQRDRWTQAQWNRWLEERLAWVLERAATRVPYYRQQWETRRRRGDRASWELLENWPILEKTVVRRQPRAFLADDASPKRLTCLHTSGSTGTPLDVWRSRRTDAALYALGMARTRGWQGLTLRDRRAMVGGQLVAPVGRRRPPFWVWNATMHQLYMSSYHLAPDLIPYYLDALVRHRIVYISGYASSLYALAQEALRLRRRDVRFTVAITSAEPLDDHQRQTIAEAFQCPVRETYGMVESVAAASECPEGRLHLWPEVGSVEVLRDDRAVPAGQTGDLVCTGLLNPDMLFIRYRFGDRGAVAPADATCPCGRGLPILAGIEGRVDDVLQTPDGRQIGRLSQVVKGLPVREAQIIQVALDRIRIRYVPAEGFVTETTARLVERMRERMGNVQVELEEVAAIPRSANGKFRAVLCQLSAAEREALARREHPHFEEST